MKVLITGGAGHIGKATVERFLQQGWDVHAIGLETTAELPGATFARCDIMNYDDLREQMRGCQAVVHLAAIRSPMLALGHQIFEANVAGTFNVFEAAAAEGIRRLVQASSINALGCAYSLTDIAPHYFPIDEEHPSNTNDPYSFSKEMVEDIGRYFWRREGISSLAMRFPWVYPRAFAANGDYERRRQAGRGAIDELGALSEDERQIRLTELQQRVMEYRKTRPLEFRDGVQPTPWAHGHDDPLWRTYAHDRFNFWTLLDERDAAQALEKGVSAQFEGAHTLYINDHCNWLGYDSKTLVRYFFPETSESRIALSGSESLVSIHKARALIGFEPEFSVSALPDTGRTYDADR